MALGHEPGAGADSPFNMAVMGLRLASLSNGVSKLHARVSQKMFSGLWPGVPEAEAPIRPVTNGVHARTWVSAEMDELLNRYVLPEWPEADESRWAHINDANDDEIWRVKEQGRQALVSFVRERLRHSALARGVSESDVAWTHEVLDPRVLTLGFARRFAAYKRATLLLSQPARLKELLTSTERPIQIVFAGKAHPADDIGKEMIRQILAFARDPDVRHRVAFVEDYDMVVARRMYQGCDVWMNTPRRPLEACGTSGMKAAINGSLNCSILDGWWDEMFNGENGWAISSAETYEDLAKRDEVEAESLFDLLERQIVPLFYDRYGGPVPRRWVRRVKASLRSLGPQGSASRMVRDYVEEMYEPAARQADALGAAGGERAKARAAGKQSLSEPGRPCASSPSTPSRPWSISGRRRRWRPWSPSASSTRTTSRCSCSTARSAPTRSCSRRRSSRWTWSGWTRRLPAGGAETRTSTATPAPSPARRPAATASASGSCPATTTSAPLPSSAA